jgi:hypothetical protein
MPALARLLPVLALSARAEVTRGGIRTRDFGL